MRQRRFLPSIRLLMAVDAVIRHQSVTAAAAELNLTQSTVSRLILTLEVQLGKDLFTRERRRLVPTAAAMGYQRDIARALDTVQRATMSLMTNPEGGTLSLAVLPTFATRWLGPRLGDFLGAHPGVAINMSTRIGRVRFSDDAFDAAIYFGEGDWDGVRHLKLMDEMVTACVSHDFAALHPVSHVDDLTRLPKLHLESRPTAWADWCAGQGGVAADLDGMIMDQFSMMIQAAISGLGVALLPDYLARTEIEEGRLRPVLRQSIRVRGAYWLAWPIERDDDGPLLLLRRWLQGMPPDTAGQATPPS